MADTDKSPSSGTAVTQQEWREDEPPEDEPLTVQIDWFASELKAKVEGIDPGDKVGKSTFPIIIQDDEVIGLDDEHPEPESTGIEVDDISRWRPRKATSAV